MAFTYEIDDTNTIRVYADENEHDLPVLLQETKPDGTPFKSKADATKWVEQYLVNATAAKAQAEADKQAQIAAFEAAKAALVEPAPAAPAA